MTRMPRERTIRLLMCIPDGHPTFRADVSTLFGKYLPRYGILSDLIAHASAAAGNNVSAWGGGEATVCLSATGGVRRHLAMLRLIVSQLMQCRRARYDAIQVRDAVLPALIGLWVARREGIPFFYWMSYPIYEAYIERAKTRGFSIGLLQFFGTALRGYVGKCLLYRGVLPASDHVFVQSQQMLESVAREGIPEGKMTPVPMGADLEEMDAACVEPAHDPRLTGRQVITYLGTLTRVRKIDFLFEVLARVKQRLPSALLVLAGDADEDSDRDWLKQRAREIGVADDIIWTGWLAKEQGWRFVRAAQVALSPIPRCFELDNGSVTKVVEYVALGVPTVCNDQPDQAHVIRESRAGLCVPYSVEGFADAVVELLEHPARAATMGSRGPAYVSAHRSYAIIAREVAETYRALTHRTRHVVA